MIDEDVLKSIERLHEMKANGVISETEFEETKAKLLSGQSVTPSTRSKIKPDVGEPGPGDYIAWAMLPLLRYAQFDGRSSRKEFWLFALAVLLAAVPISIFGAVIGPDSAALIYGLLLIGILIPSVAVQVRRFHDQGKSGWFALINLIPYVGWLIVLGFMLIEGEPDENVYGAPPNMG